MNILFLNHKIQACGVYQYGLRVANILKKSVKHNYIYIEIDDHYSYLNAITTYEPDLIIYNYHASTMSWLNSNNIQRNVKNIGIPHESSRQLFDHIFSIDPDEPEVNNVYNIPRPIYEKFEDIFLNYEIQDDTIKNFINYNNGPDVPIFGSFGFGFQNKGFDKIIDIINKNYEKAIIKLIITNAHFSNNNAVDYKIITDLCKSENINPNIKLMICNKFFTNEEILLFLNSNTANIFLYDKMIGRGISSVIDYAISANKPFIISDSHMFRNIYSDEICVYKTNIKNAIINSIKILPQIIDKYSNKNLIDKIDKIINKITWTTNDIEKEHSSNIIVNSKFHNILNGESEQNILENNFKKRVSAFYYVENYNQLGNVTNILFELFKKNKETIVASNETFNDTHYGLGKKLYINITTKLKETETLTFNENQTINLCEIIDKYKLNHTSNPNIIEVSIGEIVDKYSILELKTKYINDYNKIKEIKKEMDILEKIVCNIKKTFFYKLLLFINEQIWLDTDRIKLLSIDNTDLINIRKFAEISNTIFVNNQRRFRLKNYFNIIDNSNIKEQKSYNETKCFIEISTDEDIYDKISEINYLCISYDIIYISYNFKDIFNKLFKNPNIFFIDSVSELTNYHKESLNTFSIEINNRHKFEFEPIKYLSGGKLGDFLNQLSVICEKYYETGRKGIIYIYDLPQIDDKFIFGLKKTHEDTYNTIASQIFIKDYTIYNNEIVDYDLSSWRSNQVSDNWHNIYKKKYNVSWGKHKWLTCNYDSKWSSSIIFNVTPYRFISSNVINILKNIITENIDKCIFVSNEKEHYDHFSKELNISIKYYQPSNFDETITIVNSCEMAYLGFSGMAVMSTALHKNHILIGKNNVDMILNNLKGIIPHVLDVLV